VHIHWREYRPYTSILFDKRLSCVGCMALCMSKWEVSGFQFFTASSVVHWCNSRKRTADQEGICC
jgi:hypothetical protein